MPSTFQGTDFPSRWVSSEVKKMSDDIPLKLSEYLDLLSMESRYLLSFSPFFVNHFSAHLMSYLVNKRNQKVLYICIGRPHIFVQKLLKNRGVPIRGIHFMDMVLGISGRATGQGKQMILYGESGEEVEIPMIYKLFKVDQEIDHLSLTDVDLVILDNISELRTYSNDDRVRSLLEMLNDIWEKTGKGLMIYHINNRPNDGVGEIASEMGLEIKNEKVVDIQADNGIKIFTSKGEYTYKCLII